jgi:hypothetical protein
MCKSSEYITVLHAVNIDENFHFLFDMEVSPRDTVVMTWLSFVWGLTWHRLVPYFAPLFSITKEK